MTIVMGNMSPRYRNLRPIEYSIVSFGYTGEKVEVTSVVSYELFRQLFCC
jgi:hypothetical protein